MKRAVIHITVVGLAVILGVLFWNASSSDSVYLSEEQLAEYQYPSYVKKSMQFNYPFCTSYSFKPVNHDSYDNHLIVKVDCANLYTIFVARSIGGARNITTSFACHQYNDLDYEYYDLQREVIEFLDVDADHLCQDS